MGMETARAIGEPTSFIEIGAHHYASKNKWRQAHKHDKSPKRTIPMKKEARKNPFYIKYSAAPNSPASSEKEMQPKSSTIEDASFLESTKLDDIKDMLQKEGAETKKLGSTVSAPRPPPGAFGLDAFNAQAKAAFATAPLQPANQQQAAPPMRSANDFRLAVVARVWVRSHRHRFRTSHRQPVRARLTAF